MKDILCKLLYADNLALVADTEACQELKVAWKDIFGRHGLRVSLEKMEVLWVEQQNKELNIQLEGKTLRQRDSFVYLGGVVCRDGGMEMQIRRRIQAVTNVCRKMEGVIGNISRKLNRKVLSLA